MVDFAREKQVDFVLLAGDLYDGAWRDWRTGRFLVQQLGRLQGGARVGFDVPAIRTSRHSVIRIPLAGCSTSVCYAPPLAGLTGL